MPTQLPPKENTLFKRILKCYEQKQYKNGLKFCKQILSNPKYQEHGETLAMKGLTLNYLGRKDEAYDYVRRGLRNDLKSHVCWHVYGLLQRADHKYDEAIKCYRNALKWDKENIQILRDLSLLQVQMRDLEGFRDTRYQLLKIRPAQRQSWVGYSISYYLTDDYDMAFSIMDEFRKTLYQENQAKPGDIEHSEMLLFQNMILKETGKFEDCLKHLDDFQQHITDKLKTQQLRGSLNLELGNFEAAAKIYQDLIKRNPENWSYYEHLETCLARLNQEECLNNTDRLALYLKYRKRYPRAESPKRIPLDFTTGSTFRQLVDEYLRTGLKKGVPPLFTNLRKLYTDKEKADTIEELARGYEQCLLEHNKFALSDADHQDPTVLLWTKFYLAQHFDHSRRTALALEYIDSVLEHTPTLIEGYCVKAKIYKHAGCPVEASHWMDEGRTLDTADRYVNSKCAKYLLRANEVSEATNMCAHFTKEGSTAEEDLDSMQCMWFAVETARAYQRQGMIGEALRKCHQVEKNFSEITEDQFDFHTYCMRKVTLCAYIKLLKLEDRLRSHLFYFKAAKVAIECYLDLHDKPFSERDSDDDAGKGNLSAKELKKLKSKQRRAQKKQQVEDEKKVAETKENKESEKKEEKKEKIDPDALAKTEKPLEEAIKFLTPLQMYEKNRIETHLMAFEIYSRKGRPLLMLQSLKRAAKCDPEHPQLHFCLVTFLDTVKKQRASFSPILASVLSKQLPTLVDDADDIERLNGDYLNRHSNSLRAKLSVGKSMLLLDNSKAQEVLQLVTDLSEEQDGRDLETCSSVYKFISSHPSLRCGGAAVDDYMRQSAAIFPHAVLFGACAASGAERANREEAAHNEHAQKEKSPDNVEELSGGAPVVT